MPITTPEQLALAKRVRDHVKAHPEQHDQTLWYFSEPTCGTTACIAGWTAVLDGAQPIQDYAGESCLVAIGDDQRSIPVYARKALGLTGSEAWQLFDGCSNDRALAYLGELIAAAEASLSGASV